MSSTPHPVSDPSSTPLFQPAAEAVATPIDDGQTVVLHLTTQTYYELNATATCLWEALTARQAASRDALVNLLAGTPGAPAPQDVAQDVDAFVETMLQADLLVRTEA